MLTVVGCMVWQGLVEGTSKTLIPWQCNLSDVARAHVLAAEVPSAKGRYLVSYDHEISDKEVLDVLEKRFPQYKFNSKNVEAKPSERFLDNSKVGICINNTYA